MKTDNQNNAPTRTFLPELKEPRWLHDLADVLNQLSDRHFVLSRVVDDVNSRVRDQDADQHDGIQQRVARKIDRLEATLDALRGHLAGQQLTAERTLLTLDAADGELCFAKWHFVPDDNVSDCKLVSDALGTTKTLHWIEGVGAQIEESLSVVLEVQRTLRRLKKSLGRQEVDIGRSDELHSALFDWLQFCWSANQAMDIRDLVAWFIEAKQLLARFVAIESRLQSAAQ